MVTLYWILEYAKVLLAYLFVTFVWPSVVFRKFLKGRTVTVWFFFCVTVQIVLNNTVVLLLGLFHLLNIWLIRFLFYGTFLWSLFHKKDRKLHPVTTLKRLVTGTYGWKTFWCHVKEEAKGEWNSFLEMFRRAVRKHFWEYLLLGIILLYGMIYFSYGAFQDYSYGFGDLYPHNAWIYGLTQGQIFSAGVYPEAMHCYVYSLHALFGIRIYSCLLFLAGIHVVTYLIAAYTLFKEIFRWRFTGLFTLALFLTLDLMCINEVYSMSRLQWTLPQEFGLFTIYICAAFLIRYLRSEHQMVWKKKLTKWYWDDNLFVFMMALAASLTIHFYPTIMAFFLCVCVVPFFWKRVFNVKRFMPLVAAVICGVVIAVIPMGGALASGIPFQGSIGWAMSVIDGTEGKTQTTTTTDATAGIAQSTTGGTQGSTAQTTTGAAQGSTAQTTTGAAQGSTAQTTTGGTQGSTAQTTTGAAPSSAGTEGEEPAEKVSLTKRVQGLVEKLLEMADKVYHRGYIELYRTQRARWIVGVTLLTVVMWLAYRVLRFLLNKDLRKDPKAVGYFDASMVLTLASVVFIILYTPGSVGMPALVAGSRVCSTSQMLVLAMMMVPVDMIFTGISLLLGRFAAKLLSTCFVMSIYVGTILTGTFHGYLYYELTRFNGAVLSTYSITRDLPEDSFTIVSPTDELYQMIQYGWHEELIQFVNSVQTKDYRIPTEHVFVFVEKTPIEYAQSHFFTGPKWLAWEKYADYYNSYVSQCPDITTADIQEMETRKRKMTFAMHSKTYSNLTKRTQIEAIAEEWCEEFDRLYPNELKVYYEDDRFICYYFRQNPQNLYQLGILGYMASTQ